MAPSARAIPPRAWRMIAGPDPDITNPAETAWRATRPRLTRTSRRIHLIPGSAAGVDTEMVLTPVYTPGATLPEFNRTFILSSRSFSCSKASRATPRSPRLPAVFPVQFHSRHEGWSGLKSTSRVIRYSSRPGRDTHRVAGRHTHTRHLESP